MKIFHIAYDYPNPWSSYSSFEYELIKAQLAIKDNSITVVKAGFKPPILSHKKLRVFGSLSLLKFFGPFLTSSPYALLTYLYTKLINGVDVVIAHNHNSLFFSLYKLLFTGIDKTSYIVYFQTTSAQKEFIWKQEGYRNVSWYEKKVILPLYKLAEKLAFKTSQLIYCQSLEVFDYLEKSLGKKFETAGENRKVRVLFSGIDARHLSTNVKGLKSTYIIEDKKVILYCDYISSYGNPILLVDALAKLSDDYFLIITGNSDSVYLEKLKKHISEKGLSQRVLIKEDIFYKEYVLYYQTCDIVVFPTIKRGSQIKILEALCCNKQVLWSGPMPESRTEALIESNTWLIEDNSPKGLANEIKKILSKPKKINVLAIKEKYDWAKRALKLQEGILRITKV